MQERLVFRQTRPESRLVTFDRHWPISQCDGGSLRSVCISCELRFSIYMSMPDFLIIGTQKAGTTWLMRKLGAHPNVFMAPRQIHYFDREYFRGSDWYGAQFVASAKGQLVGEKTTEYFDPGNIKQVAPRIARTCPHCKLIVILRDPVERAWSAMVHHVNAGLVALPSDPDQAVFDNEASCRGTHHFRFVERGFYAQQLKMFYEFFDPARLLVLVFEDDVVADPYTGWAKVCDFLCLPNASLDDAHRPENKMRLSPLSIRMARKVRWIPKARGLLRMLDGLAGLQPWAPRMSSETRSLLEQIYAKPNNDLFDLLGFEIVSWRRKP